MNDPEVINSEKWWLSGCVRCVLNMITDNRGSHSMEGCPPLQQPGVISRR